MQWKAFCARASDCTVSQDSVVVSLEGGRQHRVDVSVEDEVIELRAVVAKAAALRSVEEPVLTAWRRNRAASLVGFRFDNRERLIAEAWVPKAGLKAEEFVAYVRAVARESDSLEFRLTGLDAE